MENIKSHTRISTILAIITINMSLIIGMTGISLMVGTVLYAMPLDDAVILSIFSGVTFIFLIIIAHLNNVVLTKANIESKMLPWAISITVVLVSVPMIWVLFAY